MSVTNADIYKAISDLRKETTHRIEKVEEDVDKNTAWRNQATGKLTVMFVVIGLGINIAWDFLASKLK